MRRLVLLCLSFVLLLTVWAPSANSSAAPNEDGAAVEVSGTVIDATTGDGIDEVVVLVRRMSDEYPSFEEVATTSEDGSFSFSIRPGGYQVRYDPHYLDSYAPQFWPLAHVLGDARVLTLRAGEPVEDLDAELVVGATITGRSFEESTGEPIGPAGCVQISPKGAEEEYLGSVQVSPDGRWSVDQPPVEVTVRLERCGNWHRFTYAYGALDPEDAETFVLEADETTSVGRVDMILGATITGKVTSNRTGEALAGAEVRATPLSREGGPGAFATRTDSAGRFVLDDVQPGTWSPCAILYAEFGEKQVYALGWRDGAADPRRAEPLVLESGGSAEANFQLRRSARIVVTLNEPYEGHMISDAYLRLVPGESWRQLAGMGEFWRSPTKAVIDGLPSTRLDIQFGGEDGQFWYDGVRDEADATHLRPRPGKTLRIEAHLPDDWTAPGDS